MLYLLESGKTVFCMFLEGVFIVAVISLLCSTVFCSFFLVIRSLLFSVDSLEGSGAAILSGRMVVWCGQLVSASSVLSCSTISCWALMLDQIFLRRSSCSRSLLVASCKSSHSLWKVGVTCGSTEGFGFIVSGIRSSGIFSHVVARGWSSEEAEEMSFALLGVALEEGAGVRESAVFSVSAYVLRACVGLLAR